MGNIIDAALQNPIVLAVGILLLAGLVLSFALHLVKLAVFILIVLGCYVGYLHYTGQELPPELERLEQKAEAAAETVREKAEELGERVQEELAKEQDVQSRDAAQSAESDARGQNEAAPVHDEGKEEQP